MMRWLRLYLRGIRESFSRSSNEGLEVVWQFALASVACLVFAVLSIVNAIAGDAVMASLIAAVACLGISGVTGAYVVRSTSGR
jgi:hypothetical protein